MVTPLCGEAVAPTLHLTVQLWPPEASQDKGTFDPCSRFKPLLALWVNLDLCQ